MLPGLSSRPGRGRRIGYHAGIQITGAYYGEEGIPGIWLSKIVMFDFMRALADSLIEFAG